MRLEKETILKNGKKLLAYWANNKGRGRNNCTLIIVDRDYPRPAKSVDVEEYFSQTQTSSWAGNVNLSKRVLNILGIDKFEREIEAEKLAEEKEEREMEHHWQKGE